MDARDRLFGEIAVQLQLLTREQVASCIIAQQGEHEGLRIGDIAIALGYLARPEVDIVLARQERVLEKRRETVKRAGGGGAVAEERVRKPDRRADNTVPLTSSHAPTARNPLPQAPLTAAKAAAPAPAMPPRPTPRVNSMQMGATLVAKAASSPAAVTVPVAATAPAPVPERNRDKESTADTLPTPDDYDFGAAPPARSSTMVGGTGPRPDAREVTKGGTLVQASGAVARRQPVDRAWRNPSRPPNDVIAEVTPQGMPAAPGSRPARPASRPATIEFRSNAPKPSPRAEEPIFKKPAASQADAGYLDAVLKLAVEAHASDLHAHSGAPLLARVDGNLLPLSGDDPLSASVAERVIAEVMTEAQWEALMRDGAVRFIYEIDRVRRFRAHVVRQERGVDAVFRVLPKTPQTLSALGLPPKLHELIEAPRGLVLCSGPQGSGKTCTLAALVSALVESRALHAVSIERPIEILHTTTRGLVAQYEVPTHAPSFEAAIELSLSQRAQVIAISDLSDATTLRAALRAAEAGACVIASMAATSSLHAVSSVLDAFAPGERDTMRRLLADVLRLVTYQRLLPPLKGTGRVAALEVLVGTAQVTNLIRDDQLKQLPQLMASGKITGVVSLDDSLDDLVQSGVIDAQDARSVAIDKERFKNKDEKPR